MSHRLSEEHRMFQTAVRDFAEKEIAPVASRIDKEGEFPAAEVQKMAGLGLFGLTIARNLLREG